MEESKEKELSVSTAEEADLIEGHLIPTTNEESVFYTTMEGYTMDVHRTMQATDNTTSESPPFGTAPFTALYCYRHYFVIISSSYDLFYVSHIVNLYMYILRIYDHLFHLRIWKE